ncbi:ABC transporter permease [Paenibacillus sp. NPDC058177]|uniref:ABC transporter permease n=1 Tax=Paenibacillus sp. NPDC058177 TaxID=3346369 RepID=UPI0036DEF59D
MKFLIIFLSEIKKQNQQNLHSTSVYISLLLWPIISFVGVLYSFKPFDLNANQLNFNAKEFIVFLLIGHLGYLVFNSLSQSAWQMSIEREFGTLEPIFLSPANRFAIMLGRATGALYQNIWIFVVFIISLFFVMDSMNFKTLLYLIPFIVMTFITAVIWGGLLNSIFLFARDSSIIYLIIEDPMELFSGTRVPTEVFPKWGLFITNLYPLSYVLVLLRGWLIEGYTKNFFSTFFTMSFVLIIMISLTFLLLKRAERNYREKGNLSFF